MSTPSSPARSSRLEIVDALRGFALLSIMLLHNIEHFDFYFTPQGQPAWLVALDQALWKSLFFLFGGKSYAIFALLFGLTFSLQWEHEAAAGRDFRPRFAWRLLLLLGFGSINALFYQGDILTLYATLGFSLLLIPRLRSGWILGLAVVFLLQPWLLYLLTQALQDPGRPVSNPTSWTYFARSGAYLSGSSLVQTWIGNITNGRLAATVWSWETGRILQTVALFYLGFLAGRHRIFVLTSPRSSFWPKLLGAAVVSFALLHTLGGALPKQVTSAAIRQPLENLVGSWSNFAFMLCLLGSLVLWAHHRSSERFVRLLAPVGRMSLSNYFFQSLVGTALYYGWGFGLYQHTGTTVCILIGTTLAVVQVWLSHTWFKRHRQGPLETLWHRATWWGHTRTATQ